MQFGRPDCSLWNGWQLTQFFPTSSKVLRAFLDPIRKSQMKQIIESTLTLLKQGIRIPADAFKGFFTKTLLLSGIITSLCHPQFQIQAQLSLAASINPYVLALDLDQTLIHTKILCQNHSDSHDSFKIQLKNGTCYQVTKRPYLAQFLQAASKIFKLVIFTAALKEYADLIIDRIDPKGLIKERYYRDSCVITSCGPVKHLKRIFKRKTKRVILIDDNFQNFLANPRKTYRINPFLGQADEQLCKAIKILKEGMMEGSPQERIMKQQQKRFML